jgi:CheY-like chemotaxis protein
MNETGQVYERTALVIDNDLIVLMGTVAMMRELGYTVRSTVLVHDAIAAFDAADPPDILVTDYSMPEMTGVNLAREVTTLKPLTHVLLVTGHNHINDDMPDGWQVLTKPFSSAALRHALDQLGLGK